MEVLLPAEPSPTFLPRPRSEAGAEFADSQGTRNRHSNRLRPPCDEATDPSVKDFA